MESILNVLVGAVLQMDARMKNMEETIATMAKQTQYVSLRIFI
jgi:hypothetical protein